VLERGAIELWKTFLRNEDQGKYFIPMQFAVFGDSRAQPDAPVDDRRIMTAACAARSCSSTTTASRLPLDRRRLRCS
jgi:hypothetical protein